MEKIFSTSLTSPNPILQEKWEGCGDWEFHIYSIYKYISKDEICDEFCNSTYKNCISSNKQRSLKTWLDVFKLLGIELDVIKNGKHTKRYTDISTFCGKSPGIVDILCNDGNDTYLLCNTDVGTFLLKYQTS